MSLAVKVHNYNAPLPIQLMPQGNPVEVYQFNEIKERSNPVPHRHQFDMILWATKGQGSHEIDFQQYDMTPGKLYLVRQGQVHQVNQYAESGFMILIKPDLKLKLDSSVWGQFYQKPYVDLHELGCDTFMGLFCFLQMETRNKVLDIELIGNLLNGMLLTLKRRSEPVIVRSISVELNLHLKVKALIEKYYKEEQDPDFYSAEVNMSTRKLNKIIRTFEGKTVHQMVKERLIIESKSLLRATNLSIKETAFLLGFDDPAYFCRFFKKQTGTTPNAYRIDEAVA